MVCDLQYGSHQQTFDVPSILLQRLHRSTQSLIRRTAVVLRTRQQTRLKCARTQRLKVCTILRP